MATVTGSSARAPAEVDAGALERALGRAVEGEVRFGPGDRALYSATGANYRHLPIGVVLPRTVDDVVATVEVCRRHGAPVLPRGGGTSLAGQCTNVAVVIDCSRYLNQILEIDPDRRLARVQPGVVLDDLRREAQQRHGLTFGPDPSTHAYCTLGGMIGANSCGVHSVLAANEGPGPRTSDNVHELVVLTYRGRRLRAGEGGGDLPDDLAAPLHDLVDRYGDLVRERYPDIPRRVSGYNLDDLLPESGFHVGRALAGTEGTCVTVLEATVHLVPSPPVRSLLVAGYEDAADAADHVPDVLEHRPLGLEGIDDLLIRDMTLLGQHRQDVSLLPPGRGWLLIETGGETKGEADDAARAIARTLERAGGGLTGLKLYDDPQAEQHIWEVREAGLGATAFIPGEADTYEGWEDSAVPPERLGEYLRALRKLTERYGYRSALYGHYGQGCVHARWNFDLVTADGIATWRRFLDDAAELVISLGGSISGEHGDGQARAELLPRMFGDDLVEAFREFKAIWDPDWQMNPGKVVDPRPITADLRLGVDYRPPSVETHFGFHADGGSFAHATTRCVGVGKCRRHEGGVMCPSYMVTREEKHSTRGRAHLLWEMLNGDELPLWRSEDVFEALDLCLACKGCTNECPVNVDMPTLKAEFLSHYYEHHRRPRAAYAFGFVDRWARLASHAPRLANLVTQTPGAAVLARRAAGVSDERRLPPLATETFRDWFRTHAPASPSGRRVVLWPDTFTNHFEPEIGVAAVEALEQAGLRVELPRRHLCCGRPLYDYGFLGLARRYGLRVLDELGDAIHAGVPVVGLEPSCVAVFRDDLPKLLPHDEDAKRLSREVFHLGEFLAEHVDGYEPPPLHRRILVHGHCHAHATGGVDCERALLERMGADVEVLQSGCCGMAGAWGYEKAHYDVSVACAERMLLPAVREAAPQTIVLTDGFSCRSQIAQAGTGRRALHLAQVLSLAGRHGEQGPPDVRPEAAVPGPPAGSRRRLVAGLLTFAALGAGAAQLRRRA